MENLNIRICFLLSILTYGMFGQDAVAKIYYRNGEIAFGYAEIIRSKKVKFKHSIDGKRQTLDYRDISKVELNEKTSSNTYEYMLVEGSSPNEILLLKLLINGDVNLYVDNRIYTSPGIPSGNNVINMSNKSTQTVSTYYISHKNKITVANLGNGNIYNKDFEMIKLEYFGNCASLLGILEKKEFSKGSIKDVIRYYNEECFK